MKYLRVSISTDEGTIYERDVEVRNAIDPFVRTVVAAMVEDGTIFRGEHYSALLIPRYGDTLKRKPVLRIDHEKVAEKTGWISLLYEEEPPTPDASVRYFTLEIRVVERGLVYRRDFQTMDVGEHYIDYGISQALLKLGVLRRGEYYRPVFYARDDDKADFDREELPGLQRSAASLVELVDEADPEPSFPPCDPVATYGEVERVGEAPSGTIQIYVRREAMERLRAEGRLSVDVERGGMLVGSVYENLRGGRRVVEISDLTISEHTKSSHVELRYTFESWQAHSTVMREKFPGKRVVGWYHTHLVGMQVYKDEARTEIEETNLFFSRDDVFLQTQFFPDEWYVAMVLDPRGQCIFFQWKGKEIEPCEGYYIFEEIGVAAAQEAK